MLRMCLWVKRLGVYDLGEHWALGRLEENCRSFEGSGPLVSLLHYSLRLLVLELRLRVWQLEV